MTHPLIAAAVKAASDKQDEIRLSAEGLARLLQEVHGWEFRIQIEHDVAFVMIAQRLSPRAR